MAFPSSPVNNQMAVVNGIVYSYESATNTWTRKNNTSANIITVNSANITSNTASISTTTGALKVTGGVGITGNVVAGAVYTDSYFYANGAAFVGGGGSTGYTGSAGLIGYTGSASTVIGYTGSAGTGGGGSSGTFTANAAGSITAGRGVVLNANATVSAVGTVTTAFSPSSTADQFGINWQYTNPSVAYDSVNNRVYVAYGDASTGTLKVVVGTPSGTATTWGTPANSGISIYSTTNISCAFDVASGKLVVVYSNSSNSLTNAVVCTFVAGPSVTFGTPVQIYAGLTYQSGAIYDTANNKTVIVYKYLSASLYNFAAVVGTVSGTTISFGSPTTFYTAASSSYDPRFDVTYNPAGSNIVVVYADGATGSAIIGTVSGTAISFGSAAIFRNAATYTAYGALSVTYDSGSSRIVVAYADTSNAGYVSAGSITGTTISFGTAASITRLGSATTVNLLTVAYDAVANRTFLAVHRYSDNYTWAQDIIVNDLTVTTAYPSTNWSNIPGSTADASYGALYFNASIYLGGSINKVMYLFVRTAGSGAAYSVLVTGYQITTNAGGWFGIAAGSYTNGQAATITVLGGVNTNQTGLTPNATYYIGATGTISSSAPGYGKVGVALSSTSLLVTNQTVTGYTGSAGYLGSFGYTGSIGYTGSAGSSGTRGYSGSVGYTGSAGVGYTGSAGTGGGGGASNIPPNNQTSAYTLVIGDVGKYINITTGGVTVPAGVFASGDIISIYNNSTSAQTITQGASVTMYLVGTSGTGNRTLAQRGFATVMCVGTNEFVISGGGLT